MRKISIIGAGSIVFCKTLILDVLVTPGLEDTTFCLMDISDQRTTRLKAYLEKIKEKYGLKAEFQVTTDRREALMGADYVISTFLIGGMRAYQVDYEVPLKYGVDQCIGDTLSPGGIFRAMRTIPVMNSLAAEIRELCPNALLLNYVNPMSAVCLSLANSGVKVVGLCHGVQTTLDLLSRYTGVEKSEIDYICAGINHMGWFIKLESHGKDLYPKLREVFEKPEYYANEKVRGEMFRHFGYFMTESSGHLSEYLPYFRRSRETLDTYCDEPLFGGESGAAYYWNLKVSQKYGNQDIFADEPIELPKRSVEYGSYIIEAIECNRMFRFNGNIRNNGCIENLPDNCCAEVPIFADGAGVHPTAVGKLPPQCAALNMTNVLVHQLTVEAAESGDPETLVYALSMDPLTSAVLPLPKIREMASEMLEKSRAWLPQFAGKSIRLNPKVIIPADIQRVSVPTDPALAISERMVKLAE